MEPVMQGGIPVGAALLLWRDSPLCILRLLGKAILHD